MKGSLWVAAAAVALAAAVEFTDAAHAADAGPGGSGSALSTEPIPMKRKEEFPERTPPIIETQPFLGTGNIDPGIILPTGAAWQPALWVFGDSRTAVQYFDSGPGPENQEVVTRLDLFFNAQMTATERLLLGFSPLRRDTKFTGYRREPGESEFFSEFNLDVTTLFFEGEFGEIFPNLDPRDTGALDVGFSVGRQPLLIQEGMMINDTLDSFGVTRDTIVLPGLAPDMRLTALFGWSNLHRDNNIEDDDAYLLGLFSETDFRMSTVNLDFAYVTSDNDEGGGGDGAYVGLAAIQRIGLINTAFRVNSSIAIEGEGRRVDDGTLLFAELSTTPPHGDDLVYVNAFWGIDNFSSAARDPTTGGPLGRVGILFAAVGLGSYGSALSNRADEVAGGAIGYQKFFNDERTQVVVEIGGRRGTGGDEDSAVAIGTRVQQAVGRRVVLQLDGFLASNIGREDGAGLRGEVLVRF